LYVGSSVSLTAIAEQLKPAKSGQCSSAVSAIPEGKRMSKREIFGYVAALVLGMLTLLPYFLYGGEVSSRVLIWVKLVTYAALLCGSLRLLGQLRFRLVMVYCLPVTAISMILGTAESGPPWIGLHIVAEPILCVWTGASLAWLLSRYLRHRV
jgi:hypothetical protein